MRDFWINKRVWNAIACFLLVLAVAAQPPKPPKGKVWVLNPEMSDEFDASSPGDKWRVYEQGNSWPRTAAFDSRVHEALRVVENGEENWYLSMNPMWYFEDEVFTNFYDRTYYFAGGGMDTKARATYGYYEVRIKPSNFPMGSGVFMHSRGYTDGVCGLRYGTELDIIENMGYKGPGANPIFNNKMNVNSHTKFTNSECNSGEVISTNSGVEGQALNDPLGFNIVGMWWEDGGDKAHFYLDGVYFGTIHPAEPFTIPMPLILTMETYVWGSDENNAGNPKPVEYMFQDDFRTKEERAVYYDWVRSWQLAHIDSTLYSDSSDHVGFLSDPSIVYMDSSLRVTLVYSATEKRELKVTLFDSAYKKLATSMLDAFPGIHSTAAIFSADSILAVGGPFFVVCEIRESGGDPALVLQADTSALAFVSKPLSTTLSGEKLPKSLKPAASYQLEIDYEAAGDMDIVIEMRDGSGTWIGSGQSGKVNGRGTATIQIKLGEFPATGNGYYFKPYIKPYGSHWRESIYSFVTAPFRIGEALEPKLSIADHPFPFINTGKELVLGIDHQTPSDAILSAALLDGDHKRISETVLEVREGSRILNLVLPLFAKPDPGKSYQFITVLESAHGEFETLRDSLKGLVIEAYVPKAVTGVNVQPDSLFLDPGDKIALQATILPPDAINKNISWKSEDAFVASVSSTGIVKAISPGETSVAAISEDGGIQGACVVRVRDPNAPTGNRGINEGEPEIRILPNPVESSFQIMGTSQKVDLQIFGMTGELFLHIPNFETMRKVSIIELKEGIYFVKIGTKKHTYTRKIIKLQ